MNDQRDGWVRMTQSESRNKARRVATKSSECTYQGHEPAAATALTGDRFVFRLPGLEQGCCQAENAT